MFQVYLSNMIQKQQKYKYKETLNLGVGVAFYYDLKYNR